MYRSKGSLQGFAFPEPQQKTAWGQRVLYNGGTVQPGCSL